MTLTEIFTWLPDSHFWWLCFALILISGGTILAPGIKAVLHLGVRRPVDVKK